MKAKRQYVVGFETLPVIYGRRAENGDKTWANPMTLSEAKKRLKDYIGDPQIFVITPLKVKRKD